MLEIILRSWYCVSTNGKAEFIRVVHSNLHCSSALRRNHPFLKVWVKRLRDGLSNFYFFNLEFFIKTVLCLPSGMLGVKEASVA